MTEISSSWTDLLAYYPAWVDYRRWYQRLPGVQLAVRRDGELVLSAAFGRSDEPGDVPLRVDHLFRIASHSKTFTSVLVLQLVEQGRLRLDDTVAERLPELAGSRLADRTIGELLSHSGGVIRDSDDGDFWQLGRPFPDRDELLAIARADNADVLPRNEHYKYSNIGFGLLGLIIEAESGRSYTAALADAITTPLGLRDTGGELDPGRGADYAAGHSSLATARVREVIEHVDTRALAAATGCYSTARDLTAFYSALLPGDDRLLDPDSQRRQRHRHWTVKDGEQYYGLGLILDHLADTDLFGHTGGYPGHITCTFADAAERVVLSVLTNAIDGTASSIAGGFFQLRGLARRGEHAPADESAARFTGRFASTWAVLDVARLDGRLFAIRPTAPNPAEDAAPLEIVDERSLRIVGGRGGNSYGELMRYDFAPDGRVRSLRADSGMTMTPFGVGDAP